MNLKFIGPLLLLPILFACARAPLRGMENALRKAEAPMLADDLPMEPLLEAVAGEIRFLEKNGDHKPLVFGERVYTEEEYLRGLRRFLELAKTAPDRAAFFRSVKSEFDFFEVYGQKDWGDVFITSYYEPLIEGSRRPTAKFSQPIYSAPKDLVSLNLGLFGTKFHQERQYRGRLDGNQFLPYFSREEIDSKNALKGKGLEICYVEPIDAFFLHIQGSGTIRLDNGRELRVNYAEKNGWNYEALSKFLKSRIPPEQMNLHTIEAYLKTLPRDEMQKLFNLNPSYVFFKTSTESAVTSLGVPATDGRTIATDPRYFPKGALAFLRLDQPVFDSPEQLVPSRSENSGRFVLDQDIGGAITGGGRLDLFWGRGAEAKRYAGAIKNSGRLYYLAPKRD